MRRSLAAPPAAPLAARLAVALGIVALGIAALAAAPPARAQARARTRTQPHTRAPDSARVLDSFDSLAGWSARPSDGVSLRIGADSGAHGHAMRLDFDFHGHGGYAVVHKAFDVALTGNWAFSFRVRGDAPSENLEFKLVDSTGDNVWWHDARDFEFPRAWHRVTLEKRHITFAWGPAGGGEMTHVAAIEVAITAGSGGKGTVWLDDLAFTRLDPVRPYDLTPVARASSARAGSGPALAIDGEPGTAWRSAAGGEETFTLDFLRAREYGGAVVTWAPGAHATDYVVETSTDGARWDSVYSVIHGGGGRDFLYLPETESRWLRLRLLRGASARGYAIRDIAIEPLAWSATRNDFFANVARGAPPGSHPRYLSGVQSYWTVIGVAGDSAEALINEEGMLESHAGGFSIEPFLRVGDRLVTWHEARQSQSLADEYLPIPTVHWDAGALSLDVTAWAAGEPGRSSLLARYRVTNHDARVARATLYLALRPWQVNPSWQFLGTAGGAAPVRSIAWSDAMVRVNGEWTVRPLTPPAAFGAATFVEHGIVPALRAGALPSRRAVTDPMAHASAAMAYPLEIQPGASRDVYVEIPFHPGVPLPRVAPTDSAARKYAEGTLEATRRAWHAALDRVLVSLPPSGARVEHTLKSTLAYILINDDGPAIQPGSRSYARSWIRDGAMIGAALLRLGHPEEVRAFLDWYAPHQYADGKVPCCVDRRGADPVPENDSHGELVYAIGEYWRYTGDSAFLARMWPHVVGAMAYMDSLRASRMTPEYRSGERRAYYGLLPQSISHEGYSAKPMHSYWDDLFGLLGYEDATMIAAVLGKADTARRWSEERDAFRHDIVASYRLAMAAHHIDYLPGAVELGDFDPTSTTVGVTPVGALASLPDTALRRTFDEYWARSLARARGRMDWENYTPYELRTVGTFVRLGEKARSLAMLDFFLRGQRPPAWNAWAEVVWRDPATPKFLGDLPHTWVGSDFVRSVLDFFAYDRSADSALVVGAGIPERWVREAPGVTVWGLPTPYGRLDCRMRAEGDSVRAWIGGGVRVPPGGVVVRSPVDRPIVAATVNGERAAVVDAREIVLRHLPAAVVLRYGHPR
ncbi:MAG TPA: discoidin domain-containing protein [Gemmatimonadaceae bacterium]